MSGKGSDAGGETSGDTSAVNAHESDPQLYKDALVGKTLGKCRIEALIGEGKTAVVYRAQYEPLQRTVAVKVLQEHLKKVPAVVKVFQQEGRAVAAMDHENILKIYDVGLDQGHHFLVLELLRGDTLLAEIAEHKKGKFPIARALEVIRQVTAGLTAAHRKNLVHRDIKPQNLVVEPDGTLKIVDFGLAAEAEGAFSGGRLGTPHYMAPEQCRGEMAGTASDVYALGITLFHMLVGHPPYAGRSTTEEIIQGHLEGKRLEPEKLRPDIPKGVADLVRRMTRMDMDRRPTAKEVRDSLGKSGSPKEARAPGVRRGRARSRRASSSNNTGLFLGGGVVVLALVGFLMFGGGQKNDEGEADAGKPPVTGGNTPKPKPDPVKPDPGKTTTRTKLSRKDKKEIEDALREARKFEKKKEWSVALAHYRKILLTPGAQDTPEFKIATDAAAMLTKVINAERKDQRSGRPRRISAYDSIQAGKEFEQKREAWTKRLKKFDGVRVVKEMSEYIKRTKEDTEERGAIDLAIKRAKYIESLIKMAEARAHGLEGGKELWNTHDMNAAPGLIITGATEKGIQIKDEEEGTTETKEWDEIDPSVLIGFLDNLRSAQNTNEALWLGYYCMLLGDGRSSLYFDFAANDESAEMKAELRALRGR